MRYKNIAISVIIMMCVGIIYINTQITVPTPYNYFTRLAQAFLSGRLAIPDNPPHLNELIENQKGDGYYVVYPPMPAIIAIPFIILNIADKSQTFIAITIGTLNAGLMWLTAKRLFNTRIAVTLAIMLALGTNHWYLATEGSAWYLAHICAVFFILLALLILQIRQNENTLRATNSSVRWFLAGVSISAAYWSRLPSILIIPAFVCIWYANTVNQKENKIRHLKANSKQIALFICGTAICVLLNFGYNYARFNTILDKAYVLIPGVLDEPWYTEGIFSLSYFKRNLEFILFKKPLLTENFPFVKPSLEGMSLILTSPFLIALPAVKIKKRWSIVFIATGILLLMPGLLHGTPGFSQFGYRFAMEATPLFILALGTFLERKIWWLALPPIIASIIINYWGIYAIRVLNEYGW